MSGLVKVTVYQKGNTPYPNPLTEGAPINGGRTIVSEVPHPGATAMIGQNGEQADPSIAEKVYSCINVINPSNAGTTAWFCAETVETIIAAST